MHNSFENGAQDPRGRAAGPVVGVEGLELTRGARQIAETLSGRPHLVLVLADGPPVGKFERSRRQLVAGASRGMAAALAELAPGRYVVRETLAAFGPDGHRVVVRD